MRRAGLWGVDAGDDRMREILELKEHLSKKAEEHETELEYIRRLIAILDSMLKKSSFSRASELKRSAPGDAGTAGQGEDAAQDADAAAMEGGQAGDGATPIMAGDAAVAHATVSAGEVRVCIADGVRLTADTPPWRTFFLEKIVGGMRKKDEARAAAGEIGAAEAIACDVREEGGAIREIVVRNYRDGERAEEIVGSVSWVIARMVENSEG